VGAVHERLWAAGVDVPDDCMPVEVLAAGSPLPRTSCGELFGSSRPGSCFDGRSIHARSPAQLRDDDLVLAVDPQRPCGPYTWLYPGDALTLRPAHPGTLELGATSDGRPELAILADGRSVSPVETPAGLGTSRIRVEGVTAELIVENTSPEHLMVLWAARVW
jgi:hypothetical protein